MCLKNVLIVKNICINFYNSIVSLISVWLGALILQEKQLFKVGEDYILSITGIGSLGEGVGKINSFTVFVVGALPDETVKVRLIVVKKSYAVGKLLSIIEASADRVVPDCSVFPECGGCQLQHLSYSGQLKMKKKTVEETLKRIGHIDYIEVLPVLGDKSPWRYRNKMVFPVSGSLSKIKIGCYARSTHTVVDIKDCLIQDEKNSWIMNAVREWMDDYGIKPYDEKSDSGLICNIMVRVGKTGDVMLVLVSREDKIPFIKELIQKIKKVLPSLKSIVQFIKKRNTNVVLTGKEKLLYGESFIKDNIGEFVFNISAKSFFQVNSMQTEVLYNEVAKLADVTKEQTVVELYCGTGTISLFLAQKAKKVIGIEIVEQAIVDAKKNAENNNCNNVEFILGDAIEKLSQLVEQGIKADVLILDPPRAGCDKKVLDSILAMVPDKIVYVSCNPASLARDVAFLSEKIYKVKYVQPVDMFPMTSHVETVLLLTKVENK